ncbi:hypothetical protein FKM82_029080 [Ascaphus truei]
MTLAACFIVESRHHALKSRPSILGGLNYRQILDFGLARQIENEMTGYVVTRWYRAPEVILNWMHYNQTGYLHHSMSQGPDRRMDKENAGVVKMFLYVDELYLPGVRQYPSTVVPSLLVIWEDLI